MSGLPPRNSPEVAAALARAADEAGLPEYYRASVRPLFAMPVTQWPRCCGSSCEPCAQTLGAVATRTCELLGVDPASLPLPEP